MSQDFAKSSSGSYNFSRHRPGPATHTWMLEFSSFGRTTVIVLLCKFGSFRCPCTFSRVPERPSEGFFSKMTLGIHLHCKHLHILHLYILHLQILHLHIPPFCAKPGSFSRMVSFEMLAFAVCSQRKRDGERERERDER